MALRRRGENTTEIHVVYVGHYSNTLFTYVQRGPGMFVIELILVGV